MPTDRRQFLIGTLAVGLCLTIPVATPSAQAASEPAINTAPGRLLAAWQLTAGEYQVGVLNLDPLKSTPFSVKWAVNLPTRPHGLMHLHGDEYLVVARRPGDWIMRINIRNGETQRIWQAADRHLNGHSAMVADYVYTTETDLLLGSGALGVRDKDTLELVDVWPTHGHDPHELLLMPKGSLGIGQSFLLVANGGIQTHADMGRTALTTQPMDSSLVALSLVDGTVLKQWSLADKKLSLRHLAVHGSGVVGVAMQAQHESDTARHAAPVLALLSEQGLYSVVESAGMMGYGGDIVASHNGFVVSCTKSDVALQFDVQGHKMSTFKANSACALAAVNQHIWLGQHVSGGSLELDNHWLPLTA